jgi:serine/threonine-protein kinase HipA
VEGDSEIAAAPLPVIDEPGFTSGARDELGLRFSLAGVQLKFSVIRGEDRFTVPAHDSTGDWIIKIAIRDYLGLAENEFTMMQWARGAGFDVPECQLVASGDLPHFKQYIETGAMALAVRRYDRADALRIHQEDFNQVLGRQPQIDGREKYDATYEQLGLLIREIVGNEALEEFIRRLAFVVASGNNDAHLKNWSLVYRDGVHATLAPLYDQVSTVAWPTLDRQLALKLAGARDFGRVNLDSFARVARRIKYDEARVEALTRETLESARSAWKTLDMTNMPPQHVAALREHWTRVPLLREVGPLP